MPICLPRIAFFHGASFFMKSLLRLACLVAALSFAQSASAQAVITFKAWAQDHTYGYQDYTVSYTFVFTFTTDFQSNNSQFNSTWNYWNERDGDNQLFTSITGTGVNGTYTQPTGPFSYMRIYPDQTLDLFVWANPGSTGLTSLDGTPILLSAHITPPSNVGWYDDFPVATQPSDYLAQHTGTYTFSGQSGGYLAVWDASNSNFVLFTPTEMTISAPATPVPEPATYAALAGLGALGLALWRRRSRR